MLGTVLFNERRTRVRALSVADTPRRHPSHTDWMQTYACLPA